MSLLEIKNLSLVPEEAPILDRVSLVLKKKKIYALCGPNGAGKSTLAHVVMGLGGYENWQGKIRFEGTSLKGISVSARAKLGISLAWQEPARFEGLTVADYLDAAWDNGGEVKLGRDSLAMVGLDPDEYLGRALDEKLSGGERKRIELAAICAMKPKLVFLDEPDSGVDAESLPAIIEVFQELKKQGTTIVLITHNQQLVSRADWAYLMCNGHLRDQGKPKKVLRFYETKCETCAHQNQPQLEGNG